MTMNFGKSITILMVALPMVFALGCNAEPDKSEAVAAPASATLVASNPEQVDDGITAHIISGIEAAFRDRNATGRWEGTVMHVKMAGDATATMAGFRECRVLVQLLKEGQTAIVEFPNGTLPCAEVLKEE